MKQIALFFSLNLFLLAPRFEPVTSNQDSPYLCAPNTLAMNARLCIDLTEVPGYMYKNYLAESAKEDGLNSSSFAAKKPDFQKWEELFEDTDATVIENKFFESDEFALVPLVGITKQQAEAFCDWRTKVLEAELAKMSKRERAQFPKKFKFRLPTANEWSRMRFLSQEKPMMKELDKIASSNLKVFKFSKAKLVKNSEKIDHIYSIKDPKFGFFNIFNNVSELTSEDAVAVGGSWFEANENNNFQQTFSYEGAEAWLGFRCVFEIIE